MARTKKAVLEAEFKHGTSIGANGETLYDCPIEIKDKADLDNYGITDADCRYLNFNRQLELIIVFVYVNVFFHEVDLHTGFLQQTYGFENFYVVPSKAGQTLRYDIIQVMVFAVSQ